MLLITDELRRDLGIGTDCGVYDPIRNRWHVLDAAWNYYTPFGNPGPNDDQEEPDTEDEGRA